MSVHSHSAAPYQAATPDFPRHVVTAVLVAHDGARWLPEALSGLIGQERPVQNVIAADTGSADDSARLITEALGPDRVLHMARRTGFGAAVDEAVRTAAVLTPDDLPYLRRPSGWDPVTRTWHDEAYDMPELPHGEPVQWLWLLHDDCAPAPDALHHLLRVVDADPSVAVVGPKLRSWYDSRQLLEAGVTIANSGRRWTGVERREQDQGQHDQVRPVLSVSSAGMLIRRDVFEGLGGFERRLPLMRDDVDLCWRANAAGHRVLVAPDAHARHAEAASRERRPVDCAGRGGASPHRVDKSGAVFTMLANAPGRALPWVLLRLVLGTLLRTLAYLVGKAPGQALDEVSGLFGTLLRPLRVLGARRRRGKPVVDHRDLRPLFPPPGATLRATVEQVASNFAGRAEPDRSSGGRHGAVESGPTDEEGDFLEVEQFARLKRMAHKPGPVLFAVLLVVSLIACRSLLAGGALAGGALLPAPADVGDLWARYTDAWHPVGVGGTQTAPPYLAVLALVATLLFGSTGLALTLLLVCSVPLAGLTAYFASRPLVDSRLVRAWAAVAYAFLPAATGALAGGRIGTAVLAIVLPLLARAAIAASGLRRRASWRAVWAYALLLTFTTAFTPVVWPMAALLGLAVVVLAQRRGDGVTAAAVRAVAVIGTPVLLLAPWSLSLLTDPSRLLTEAGLPYGAGAADALDLLTLSPGGPGAAGGLLLAGIVLAALAALLRDDRQTPVRVAWVVALVGLLFAALANAEGWAGPATLVYGIALLTAAAVGAEGARERVALQNFGWKQPVAGLIAAAAVAAPLLAAVGWMAGGADGPLTRRSPVQVPAFVAEESSTEDQARTLVLSGEAGESPGSTSRVSYAVVRGSGARLGDADLTAGASGDTRLNDVVAHLVAGSGADQTGRLRDYAVAYVLVRDDAPRRLSRTLDATPGLTRLSQEDGSALWRVDTEVSRIAIVPGEQQGENGGGTGAAERVAVPAGPVEAHTDVPSGPQGRVLRIADRADEGWHATLDGRELTPATVDDWAQGFELPAEGGRLDLTYQTPVTHTVWLWTQVALVLVVVVLALPGRRRDVDDDLPEAEAVPAQPVAGEGRRARRLRAAAAAEASAQDGAPHDDAWPEEFAGQAGVGAAPGVDGAVAGDVADGGLVGAQGEGAVPGDPSVPGAPQVPPMPEQVPYGQYSDQYADHLYGQAHVPTQGGAYTADPYTADPYVQQYEAQQPYPPGGPAYGDWERQQYPRQYGYDPDAGGDPSQAGGAQGGTPYGDRSENQ